MTVFFNFLTKLGLQEFYPNKLTLQSLLEINKNSIYEEAISSVEEIPWCFLRKLFKINAECRNSTKLANPEGDKEEENSDIFDLDLYTAEEFPDDNEINLLDLIVALFLCADSFLQQEIALKMSMCQFSVPLLLPHGNGSQCTLMAWSMSDIVKEWCPHDLSESRGFVENSIVQAKMPFYAFVRLKNCSLSKSQILNHLLSHGQQTHSIFIHRDMEGGTHERKISNGLAEVCWYLPCGTANLDILPGPAGFCNLRGDISESLTQFIFLFKVSNAVFVFLDKIEENEQRILTSLEDVQSKLFLVVNYKNAKEDMTSVKTTVKELSLSNANLKIKDSKTNVAEFSKKLCVFIKKSLLGVTPISIENMLDKAVELGLSLDENKREQEKKAAQGIVDGTDTKSIQSYKEQQLPLQGDNWKMLSKLEKEECRLKEAGELGLEEYKTQVQAEKVKIIKKQTNQKVSMGMTSFIEALTTSDIESRYLFLKWMKFKLNTCSRDNLTMLRNDFKEQCKKKDAKLIAELDKALQESSLGIEHYMREMGLIYEFSKQSEKSSHKMSHLPGLAAEMLLDGYPLELLDGDASNIPERWVTDVLIELHKKAGNSRLLVLTVLGVQSTGKSTLLNTMFGVQFPVCSGRCTRGAYMLFLKLSEDMRNHFGFDFIVLIDTEGLKSPNLALLEDSYEHDNQLATFVIGLSDVTIINIAMENSTEMKDVLQIAVHAFLRMRKIGKKPVCHFVHQNVAEVSAHAKTMTERKYLLEQLNEMTQIAAEMEKQPSIQAFTDVLDYDIEKNSWNIPGLWHGTPPMAPVNIGYSEAVAKFKKNLLEMVKIDISFSPSEIPEFLQLITRLWKAVKYENFIFSFRNTLVAHAYNNLCKEFGEWEWEFHKEILSRQTAAELDILNADDKSDVSELVESKKHQMEKKIAEQEKTMAKKLHEYYKKKDKHVHLIEKYKTDFLSNIKCLAKEIKGSVNKLDCAFELRTTLNEVQSIQRKHREMIEEQVMKLLNDCKHKNSALSEKELEDEFEKMWAIVTAKVSGLKEQNIPAKILIQLRKNLLNRNVNEELQNIGDLNEIGKNPFQAQPEYIKSSFLKKMSVFFARTDGIKELQNFVDSVIETCTRIVRDIAKTKGDYNDSFTRDLLEKVDGFLQQRTEQWKPNFEIDLKIHICAIAAREFLHMHKEFLRNKDPRVQLEKKKAQYLSDFLDLYKQTDHCQRKAATFVSCCIQPAVEEYIMRFLGINIVDEILTSSVSAEYSTRSIFQYNIQKELLQKDFQSFVKYILSYEIYVKDWIFQNIVTKMSESKTLYKLKNKNLEIIFKKVTLATEQASKGKDGAPLPDNQESISKLICELCKYLRKDIFISEEATKPALFQIQSTCHKFKNSLMKSLNEMKETLQDKVSDSEDITEILNKLPIKPQDELFKRVFGCGKQCPFCKVPCEAGGKEHKNHHAAIHRPQALGRCRDEDTAELIVTLCTTSVHSESQFKNTDTNFEWHPYKEYTTYYPDWIIPPDPTIEASDYWKYVLAQYNDRFALTFMAKPADVPDAWRMITKKQALKGLKHAFNVN